MMFQREIGTRVYNNGKIGVLLEIEYTCKNAPLEASSDLDSIKTLIDEILFHIAIASPLYISECEIPNNVLIGIKDFYRNKAVMVCQDKSADIIEKAVNGWLNRFFIKDVCLMEQPWIKDISKTIRIVLNEFSALTGRTLYIKRFVRFELGETIEVDYKERGHFYS